MSGSVIGQCSCWILEDPRCLNFQYTTWTQSDKTDKSNMERMVDQAPRVNSDLQGAKETLPFVFGKLNTSLDVFAIFINQRRLHFIIHTPFSSRRSRKHSFFLQMLKISLFCYIAWRTQFTIPCWNLSYNLHLVQT